jgi:GDP-6-deoxy-D-talose 4-dehydrogenase
MARVLITGANGFSGPYVTAALSARGHEVYGLSKADTQTTVAGVARWYFADLMDYAALTEVIAEVQPEYIVHLAAISFVPHARISEIYQTNIIGTRNLLEALSVNCETKSAVIVSSAHVYGNRVGGALDESTPPDPHSDYALSKLACEHLARMYIDRVPSIVVRPFNYTGRGQETQFIIPKIVHHIRSKQSRIELGNISVARDFSDVRFFAESVAELLPNPNAIGEIVNVCSGKAYTLTYILDLVKKISGREIEVIPNPAFFRVNDVMRLWGDPTKLRKLVGELDSPSIGETLRWMLEE